MIFENFEQMIVRMCEMCERCSLEVLRLTCSGWLRVWRPFIRAVPRRLLGEVKMSGGRRVTATGCWTGVWTGWGHHGGLGTLWKMWITHSVQTEYKQMTWMKDRLVRTRFFSLFCSTHPKLITSRLKSYIIRSTSLTPCHQDRHKHSYLSVPWSLSHSLHCTIQIPPHVSLSFNASMMYWFWKR